MIRATTRNPDPGTLAVVAGAAALAVVGAGIFLIAKRRKDAAAAAAIDATKDDVNTGDKIFVDIDVAGTGAKGLFVELTFQLP